MDFQSFCLANGVAISTLMQGDRIFRCPTTTHPGSKNGAYFFDGRRGWCQNWETGEPAQWWNDDRAQPWSDAEKREWANRRRIAEESKRKAQAEAAKRAAVMIAGAARATHPYLKEKGLEEELGLVTPESDLLVPMRDFSSNELMGVQVIRLVENEWEKKMIYGMRAKGAVLRIGSRKSAETIFVEGYATGLSVDIALRLVRMNMSVLICFSAQNLVFVANNTSGRRYVFADHDASNTGERAAKETNLPYCMADEVGMDANDLHRRDGVMAVAKKLMQLGLSG